MGNVVITGGSRGIGAATVELFASRGDRVTFLYEKNHAAAKAVELAQDKDETAAMRAAQRKNVPPDAADRIAERIVQS